MNNTNRLQEYITTLIDRVASEGERTKGNPSIFVKKEKKPSEGNYDDTVFPDMDEEAVKKALGRKYSGNLRQLIGIVELFKNRASTKHISTFVFPRNSNYLLDIYGSSREISRVVANGVACGLLKCVKDTYRFDNGKGECKKYAWNKKVEKIILKLCKDEGIVFDASRRSTAVRKLLKAKPAVSKKAEGYTIRFAQRVQLPKDLTDDEIVLALFVVYPQLRDAMETVERMNESLPPDEQMRCFPTIHRSKGAVTKIGFRITNPLVSAKEHPNENADYNGVWRKDLLAVKLGSWIDFDVKSSIYRVTYLMNYGEWLPQEIDLYEAMAGFKFKDKEQRNTYKNGIAMSLYFDDTAAAIVNHLKSRGAQNLDGDEVVDAVEQARARMNFAIGPSFRSEIFLHESLIYLEAYRRMVEEKGWRVIQIYDGFYVQKKEGMDDEEVRKEVCGLIEECAYWYLNKYYNKFLRENNK